MIVLKFGGSSCDGGERIAGAAAIAAARSEPRLVVVSAMGKGTSELQALAAQAAKGDPEGAQRGLTGWLDRHRQALAEAAGSGDEPAWVRGAIDEEGDRVASELERISGAGEVSPQANDAVVSAGELLSSRIFAAALSARGVPTRWIDPRDLVATDDRFGAARPDRARIFRKVERLARPALERGEVVVTGGYLGRAVSGAGKGETTTMGRESSDLSATLLGAALRAEAVEIWTDVDGILTADPRLVPAARLVPALSYREAALLARLGAKVIHPDTVAPAASVGAEVRIRNRFRPEAPGSVIGPRCCDEPLWTIAARETLLESSDGAKVKVRFPSEGSWALATGYRLGSVPLTLRVARRVIERVGRTPRVLVSLVGRMRELDAAAVSRVRSALAGLDAVPVPGRGIALSHLVTLDEAREAVERLHRAAFEEAPAVARLPARERGPALERGVSAPAGSPLVRSTAP
jgi:aspartate kinase